MLAPHRPRPHGFAETVSAPDPFRATAHSLVDLPAFWRFLRRRARLIGVVAAAVMLCAIGALALIPARYTATAVLLADPRQQRVVPSEAVLSGIGSDAAAVESQVEIIQSRALALRVIRELRLDEDPEFARGSTLGQAANALRDLIGLPRGEDEAMRLEKIVGRFQARLKVQRRGLTYILEVGFAASEPEKAARIANAVAQAYLEDQIAAKYDATIRATGWLNDRLEELRAKVRDSEKAVEVYKAQNNIVDVGAGQTLTERQIAELNQQLILARARTAEARARLDQVKQASARAAPTGSLPEALQSQVIANLRAQHAQLASTEAELRSTFGERHPTLASVRAQIDKVSAQIEREVARIASGLQNEYEAARSREASLEASLAGLKQQAAGINQATVRLRELEREAQANRALFEQFLLRFKETSEQQSLQRADARIISAAAAPVAPSHPRTGLILVLALVGSALAGVGAAALAETMTAGLRTAEEVERLLRLPLLGSLPRVEPVQLGRGARVRLGKAARQAHERALMRFSIDQPLSPFAEALRALRLRLRSEAGRPRMAILVTSAAPGEGKSTIAMNLALALARSGAATLLIDADLRNSCLSRLQAPGAPGLYEAVEAGLELKTLLRKDAGTGLTFLPAGRIADPAAAAELLLEARAGAVLDACRARFDVVVIDGPPLLPVADSRLLLEQADAGLLVVEWAKTDAESALAALRDLGGAAPKLLGAVMNKIDPRCLRSYDYAYGGRGDGNEKLAA